MLFTPFGFGWIKIMFFRKHTKKLEVDVMPQHIAIIMDGNGRWAKKRGLMRMAGHTKGAAVFKTIARYCNAIGIRYLTVYAFSTENWKRPASEINSIMNLLRDYLKDSSNFKGENIKLQFIGDRTMLSDDIIKLMANAEKDSENATGLIVSLAINYGGRDDIIAAAKTVARDVLAGTLSIDAINEASFSKRLYTCRIPDPDLIIRPSGEYRISNFLLWQAAYSEFWYADVLWPDFTPAHLNQALEDYAGRHRRFGNVE